MSGTTSIQWTDKVWNPVVGCTKVSQGRKLCYAKTLHDRRHKAHLAGKKVAPQYAQPFERVQLMPDRLDAPLRWQKPQRVFVNSVSDLFHEDVPDYFIAAVFGVMAAAQRQTFQVLTKRPDRMRHVVEWLSRPRARSVEPSLAFLVPILERYPSTEWPLRNVWLGVSVENQAAADERIPLLHETPAAVRFLSCEPLLGPLDLSLYLDEEGYIDDQYVPPIDWVIVGGESGKGARSMDLAWVEQILADCDVNGVAAFVKQLGRRPTTPDLTHWRCPAEILPDSSGYTLELRDSHGGDMSEWPERLRVREFPTALIEAHST